MDFYNLMTKGKPAPPANASAPNSPLLGTERSPTVAASAGDVEEEHKSFVSRV